MNPPSRSGGNSTGRDVAGSGCYTNTRTQHLLFTGMCRERVQYCTPPRTTDTSPIRLPTGVGAGLGEALGNHRTTPLNPDQDAYKQMVKRNSKAVSSGDFDAIGEICTEGIVNHTPVADTQGHAALKASEARIHEAYPGFDVTSDDLLVEGNRVALPRTITGVHQGTMMDIGPTGREVTFGNTIYHRLVDDLSAERWVQPDVFEILLQLDPIEGPPQPLASRRFDTKPLLERARVVSPRTSAVCREFENN